MKRKKISRIDQKIEYIRGLLDNAVRRSKVPIAQNPKVLTLSRILDMLLNQIQLEKEEMIGGN